MIKKQSVVVLLALSVGGCSMLLPKKHIDTTPFQTFDDAKAAIESLVPMQSDLKLLAAKGIDLNTYPNATMLTHSDVVRRFVPSTIVKREDLDPGILLCIESRDACRGVDVAISKITKTRTGNFFADFANFNRRTHTTGWRLHAVILLVNDKVVYRAWGGQAVVDQLEESNNPLGPLQNLISDN
jgi:hypothetical protein